MDTALIINGIFTLAGAAIGAYITYRCSLGLLRRAEYIKACAEFEIAFFEIIHWLKYEAVNDSIRVPGKLKDLHQRHLKAIANFRAFIRGKQRRGFDLACERFYNRQNDKYYLGDANLDTSSLKEESIGLVLNNIYGLLHFTESPVLFKK